VIRADASADAQNKKALNIMLVCGEPSGDVHRGPEIGDRVVQAADGCLVGAGCYAPGVFDPTDVCLVCDPARNVDDQVAIGQYLTAGRWRLRRPR